MPISQSLKASQKATRRVFKQSCKQRGLWTSCKDLGLSRRLKNRLGLCSFQTEASSRPSLDAVSTNRSARLADSPTLRTVIPQGDRSTSGEISTTLLLISEFKPPAICTWTRSATAVQRISLNESLHAATLHMFIQKADKSSLKTHSMSCSCF